MANSGTIFLDEVGELSLACQVKMLRFLETMEVTRVGGSKPKKLDVRVISATNKSLEDMVKAGTFREDLYYRLNVVYIRVPPLRERPDEILPMASNFLAYFKKKYQKDVVISEFACEVLLDHPWPGNVRQLKNAIEYAVATCDDIIESHHLPNNVERSNKVAEENQIEINGINNAAAGYNALETNSEPLLSSHIKEIEKEAIKKALLATNNNRTKAMEMLGISRKTFYKKLKEYNLS
jgi:transcriptional regulator with PAS, ATPase and Fis domain